MNAAIELHDSELTDVTHDGDSVVFTFDPAILHRSEGQPGVEMGSCWLQTATFAFSNASVSELVELPCSVIEGTLHVGNLVHENVVPASGEFSDHCELRIIQNSVSMSVRGSSLVVRLQGEPKYLQAFSGRS